MVISKAKDLTKKLTQITRRGYKELTAADVTAAREYIARYWAHLTRFNPKDNDSLIGLPNPYLVPSYAKGHEFDYDEMFYWDSYFMVQCMLDAKHKDLVTGILDNLIFLFKRFKIVPNASRLYQISRSQPPFLTSFILDVYRAYDPGKMWLEGSMKIAEEEYETVWMGLTKPNARQVYNGLSRYYDFNYLHDIAEAESGWDMTPRFNRRALNYLPVDLNALLYKYEIDFAEMATILGHRTEADKWKKAAGARASSMNELMWSELRGFYFDYNFVKRKRGGVYSLAAYYPMWAGMVSPSQAKKLVENLHKFEHKGGLATTDAMQLGALVPGAMPTQWAYPNGWAPLHLIVIQGLERYGYHEDARRIALKWLKTNNDWFIRHGVFLEKYNVVQPSKPPLKGVYPSQTGFGWTNSVFELLCQQYLDTDK